MGRGETGSRSVAIRSVASSKCFPLSSYALCGSCLNSTELAGGPAASGGGAGGGCGGVRGAVPAGRGRGAVGRARRER